MTAVPVSAWVAVTLADHRLHQDLVAVAGHDPPDGSIQLVDRELAIGSSQQLGLVPGQPDNGNPWFQPCAVRVAAEGGQQHQPVQPRVAPQGRAAARLSTSAAALPPGL